ncbi:MAG: hypothetical protein K1X29_04240 [Bdellovibrionales bacterium]|nr:hypothetical protein [Bdellovibrionales bacterium]
MKNQSEQIEKGFNSDIMVNGIPYHIQTEDWGRQNPFFVSRVFSNGAVIKSIKMPYSTLLSKGAQADQEEVRFALRCQHEQVLDLLVSGQLINSMPTIKR